MLVVAIAAGMGFAAPRAYLARRKRLLTQRFRQVYPDFLDLLVVCVDAGLAVEAALERITSEIGKQSCEFAVNLTWLVAETRAGRSLTDALENFADRISLDEARSLVLALRQSATLGSNLAHALVVYSADMRERRLLRAEAEANKLPVKIMAPLGLLIFPVILLVVALPALVRLVPIFLRH
ncbi:MAG: type II secretion system F family protein [Xanthobacteraceae bacterium]